MELICFPSRDPLHDLVLPAHLKPTRVWLPVIAQREDEAHVLSACLERQGVTVEQQVWPSFAECADPAAEVLSHFAPLLESSADSEVILALGEAAGPWEQVCQQVLRGLLQPGEFRVMVLTASLREMVQIEPAPIKVSSLPSLLKPSDYLAACNATLRGALSDRDDHIEVMRSRRPVTLHLARHCGALASAMGSLNYLATQALDEPREALQNPQQTFPFKPARPLKAALKKLEQGELLDFDDERGVYFKTAAACRYVAGGWIEEYAWLTASELGAEHVQAGLEMTWNTGPGIAPRNELDLFVLHRNRALTVECKTASMGEGDLTAKILYKLDSIADRLNALPGNAALLSAQQVPELIVKRAQAQGTVVFDAARLVDFRDWLKATIF
jgi:hypothetical protein